MRRTFKRSGGLAGAVALVCLPAGAAAGPAQAAPAQAGDGPRPVKVFKKRLSTRVGRRIMVTGRLHPSRAGRRVRLQVRDGGRWRTVDRTKSRRRGRYVIRDRQTSTLTGPARLVAGAGAGKATRRVGRVSVYRVASASWYGPGLYGNRTACGQTLTPSTVGVAHKQLPCGTRVRVKHGGRSVRVRVIDRGPFVGNREFDLTSAVARRLDFSGHGPVLVAR